MAKFGEHKVYINKDDELLDRIRKGGRIYPDDFNCDLELNRTICDDFEYEECYKWWQNRNQHRSKTTSNMQSEETIKQLISDLKQKNENIRKGKHTITDPYEKDIAIKTNKIWIQCLQWVLDGKSPGYVYEFNS